MPEWHLYLFSLLAPCIIKQGLEIAAILGTLKGRSPRLSFLILHSSSAGEIQLCHCFLLFFQSSLKQMFYSGWSSKAALNFVLFGLGSARILRSLYSLHEMFSPVRLDFSTLDTFCLITTFFKEVYPETSELFETDI